MNKPDNQQRGLAGEYYVAAAFCRLGYDIAITIGRAKAFDLMATGTTGKTISIQVKTTYQGYDWLVGHDFDSNRNSVVALVRLGTDATRLPELYFLSGVRANELKTHKYKNHSPRISRAEVRQEFQNHDVGLVKRLLGE